MKQYKFLIIGGLHGNEPLGVELVKKIQQLKIPNIKAIYGNPEAIIQNKRFLDQDLNRVFPGKVDGNLEQKRAFEITQICKNYDFVLDFHNTHCPNNDCGFVGGDSYNASLKLSSFLGLNKIIVADYDCINKYIKNCLSVEISLDSKLNDVNYWISKILSLADFDLKLV
jgi:predicted deacylase